MTEERPAEGELTDTEARVTALIAWSERMYVVMCAAGGCMWGGLAAGALAGLPAGYAVAVAAGAVALAAMVAGPWLMVSAERLAKTDVRTTPGE